MKALIGTTNVYTFIWHEYIKKHWAYNSQSRTYGSPFPQLGFQVLRAQKRSGQGHRSSWNSKGYRDDNANHYSVSTQYPKTSRMFNFTHLKMVNMEIGTILLKMHKFALSKYFMHVIIKHACALQDTIPTINADKTRFSKMNLLPARLFWNCK